MLRSDSSVERACLHQMLASKDAEEEKGRQITDGERSAQAKVDWELGAG